MWLNANVGDSRNHLTHLSLQSRKTSSSSRGVVAGFGHRPALSILMSEALRQRLTRTHDNQLWSVEWPDLGGVARPLGVVLHGNIAAIHLNDTTEPKCRVAANRGRAAHLGAQPFFGLCAYAGCGCRHEWTLRFARECADRPAAQKRQRLCVSE